MLLPIQVDRLPQTLGQQVNLDNKKIIWVQID